jgi:alpha-1,2-mannosyltransferase
MYLSLRSVRSTERSVHGWLTRERFVPYSLAMCALYVVFLWTWARVTHNFTAVDASRPAGDFMVFWSASHVMLHGTAAQVYNITSFSAAERALFASFPKSTFLPWLYPPTFLLLVIPLSWLPVVLSYLLFMGTSVLLYARGALAATGLARWAGSARAATLLLLSSPCVFVTAIFGQNSLLTGALALFAVRWVDRYPVRSGICIGLLSIKPQMALLFPLVLIAARAWRVMAVAAVTAVAFAALSLAVCGTHSAGLFVSCADIARSLILEHGTHFWLASPTAFAALRLADVPLTAAYAAQALVAVLAIVSACQIWRSTPDIGTRTAVLALATLIANPYVWHYELAWLGFTLAWLLATGLRTGWLPGEQPVIALAWLLPLYELFNRYLKLPQIGPVILLLLLLIVLRRVRSAQVVSP